MLYVPHLPSRRTGALASLALAVRVLHGGSLGAPLRRRSAPTSSCRRAGTPPPPPPRPSPPPPRNSAISRHTSNRAIAVRDCRARVQSCDAFAPRKPHRRKVGAENRACADLEKLRQLWTAARACWPVHLYSAAKAPIMNRAVPRTGALGRVPFSRPSREAALSARDAFAPFRRCRIMAESQLYVFSITRWRNRPSRQSRMFQRSKRLRLSPTG